MHTPAANRANDRAATPITTHGAGTLGGDTPVAVADEVVDAPVYGGLQAPTPAVMLQAPIPAEILSHAPEGKEELGMAEAEAREAEAAAEEAERMAAAAEAAARAAAEAAARAVAEDVAHAERKAAEEAKPLAEGVTNIRYERTKENPDGWWGTCPGVKPYAQKPYTHDDIRNICDIHSIVSCYPDLRKWINITNNAVISHASAVKVGFEVRIRYDEMACNPTGWWIEIGGFEAPCGYHILDLIHAVYLNAADRRHRAWVSLGNRPVYVRYKETVGWWIRTKLDKGCLSYPLSDVQFLVKGDNETLKFATDNEGDWVHINTERAAKRRQGSATERAAKRRKGSA